MTTYIVIDIDTQTALIDFSQINTTSSQTMRRNVANTQAMLSYQVTPSFITNGRVDPLMTLDHAQAIALLQTPDWTPLDENASYWEEGSGNWVTRDLSNNEFLQGNNTGAIDEMQGNAPGSEASGTGSNLAIADLIGDMKDSKLNAFSINMADYADGVTNPANSGRSTEVPSV